LTVCAGCPGGRAVSEATAWINLHGMKQAVLQELRRSVGNRAGISVFGDRWVLAHRTGKREMFDDVEALAAALGGLLDGRKVPETPAGAAGPGRIRAAGSRADAAAFVAALLAAEGAEQRR
jgi:hypothetical protein